MFGKQFNRVACRGVDVDDRKLVDDVLRAHEGSL
jgi:hypothetical protein